LSVPPTALTDGYLRLRPYRPQDAPDLYEAIRESQPDLYRFMPWCHADYTLVESQQWLATRQDAWINGEDYCFAIEEAGTCRYLGGCGIDHINQLNRFANLGYWVRTGVTGHGIATAATRLLIPFGFDALGLLRIEIVAAVHNVASLRVAEKVGAVREGVLRHSLYLGGAPRDAVMHSVLPSDLPLPELTS
jgi:ribosomal-protein-serine acetyltransferase